ncbi:unnamed protein product, partial [marine sediment metagenome]
FYPDSMLDEQLSIRIANIMDQTVSEGFFTHSFEKNNSNNYYFEILQTGHGVIEIC